MEIGDDERVKHYLHHVSYYRLRAYWLPYEVICPRAGDHVFAEGTSFDDVLRLYIFDRQLRLLIMDAVERIEVSLRGAWAYHMATKYGPHGYVDPSLYDRPDRYARAYSALIEEVKRSKDTFVVHYRSKYTEPTDLPIWMVAEVISLGQLSKWVSNLKLRADRKGVAQPYGVDERVLTSLLHHLTYVRNICAHHGRLWNKQFTVTMQVPNSPASLRLNMNPASDRKIYNTLTFMIYLMKIVASGSSWRAHLLEHVKTCPLGVTEHMGFPPDWLYRPLWKA